MRFFSYAFVVSYYTTRQCRNAIGAHDLAGEVRKVVCAVCVSSVVPQVNVPRELLTVTSPHQVFRVLCGMQFFDEVVTMLTAIFASL